MLSFKGSIHLSTCPRILCNNLQHETGIIQESFNPPPPNNSLTDHTGLFFRSSNALEAQWKGYMWEIASLMWEGKKRSIIMRAYLLFFLFCHSPLSHAARIKVLERFVLMPFSMKNTRAKALKPDGCGPLVSWLLRNLIKTCYMLQIIIQAFASQTCPDWAPKFSSDIRFVWKL